MTAQERPGLPPARTDEAREDVRAPRKVTSAELLAGRREVQIWHAGEIYTLRQTNKGKLILTK